MKIRQAAFVNTGEESVNYKNSVNMRTEKKCAKRGLLASYHV